MIERPEDDGHDPDYESEVMQEGLDQLSSNLVGQKIVSVHKQGAEPDGSGYVPYGRSEETVFTLSNGRQVVLEDTDDCCAYTQVSRFEFLSQGEHVITRVEADEGFETWSIYSDRVPVAILGVEWSPGNPYYYGFGFNVRVKENN